VKANARHMQDTPPASKVATTGLTNNPESAGTYIWKVRAFLVVLVAVILELDTSPRAVAANVTDLHTWFNTKVLVVKLGISHDVDNASDASLPRPVRRNTRFTLLLKLVTT
jgi:hypothetical protein